MLAIWLSFCSLSCVDWVWQHFLDRTSSLWSSEFFAEFLFPFCWDISGGWENEKGSECQWVHNRYSMFMVLHCLVSTRPSHAHVMVWCQDYSGSNWIHTLCHYKFPFILISFVALCYCVLHLWYLLSFFPCWHVPPTIEYNHWTVSYVTLHVVLVWHPEM